MISRRVFLTDLEFFYGTLGVGLGPSIVVFSSRIRMSRRLSVGGGRSHGFLVHFSFASSWFVLCAVDYALHSLRGSTGSCTSTGYCWWPCVFLSCHWSSVQLTFTYGVLVVVLLGI